LPIESVADLISYAKAHPGALTYGSGGAGSPHQLLPKHIDIAEIFAFAGRLPPSLPPPRR
jgi:tripartite-type tricarboxylate transporter receptor subunit TctC